MSFFLVSHIESQRPAKSYIVLQTVRHRFNIYASSCVALAHDAEISTATRYTLRRNTASIMKGLIWRFSQFLKTQNKRDETIPPLMLAAKQLFLLYLTRSRMLRRVRRLTTLKIWEQNHWKFPSPLHTSSAASVASLIKNCLQTSCAANYIRTEIAFKIIYLISATQRKNLYAVLVWKGLYIL